MVNQQQRPPRFVGVAAIGLILGVLAWVAYGVLIARVALNVKDGVSVFDGMMIAFLVHSLSRQLRR